MGQFFPTIVREVQYRVQRRMGVAPAITAVMRALPDGARGSTVTAYAGARGGLSAAARGRTGMCERDTEGQAA
eukprot:5488136-Prymnesium_polylepis.1